MVNSMFLNFRFKRPGVVLSLCFFIFGDFEPHYSYKIVLIRIECTICGHILLPQCHNVHILWRSSTVYGCDLVWTFTAESHEPGWKFLTNEDCFCQIFWRLQVKYPQHINASSKYRQFCRTISTIYNVETEKLFDRRRFTDISWNTSLYYILVVCIIRWYLQWF